MTYPKTHLIEKPAVPYVSALNTDITRSIERAKRKLRGKQTTVRVGRVVFGKVVVS